MEEREYIPYGNFILYNEYQKSFKFSFNITTRYRPFLYTLFRLLSNTMVHNVTMKKWSWVPFCTPKSIEKEWGLHKLPNLYTPDSTESKVGVLHGFYKSIIKIVLDEPTGGKERLYNHFGTIDPNVIIHLKKYLKSATHVSVFKSWIEYAPVSKKNDYEFDCTFTAENELRSAQRRNILNKNPLDDMIELPDDLEATPSIDGK